MVACGTLNYCGQAFFVGAVNPNSALLVLTSDGDVDLLDAHSESTGQASFGFINGQRNYRFLADRY